MKQIILFLTILIFSGIITACLFYKTPISSSYYPEWLDKAKYNSKITVLDTDSALGRYSEKTKEIGLKDIVKYHGHLCDGMVIVYIELKAALGLLFPDGKIDRTDFKKWPIV